MESSPPIIYYSIGRRCNAVELLQKHGLFTECSPFDWDVVAFRTVIQMLSTDFKGYCDNAYLPWTGQMVRNAGKHDTPKEKGFRYLKIKLPRHKNFAVNLGTVADPKRPPANLYEADRGLFFFHYDLKDSAVVEKKKRRAQRFIANRERAVLFYIWHTLARDKVASTIKEVVQLVHGLPWLYRFVIVLCVENAPAPFAVDERDERVVFLHLRVPPLAQQLKTKPNENNVNDPRINWTPVIEYLKRKRSGFLR